MLARPAKLLFAAYASVLAALVLVPEVGAWVIRSQVLPRVSAKIGRQVRAGEVWFRYGRVELRDLEIDGGDAAPPLKLPRVWARFELAPLFAGRVEVPEVELDHPRIELVRSSGRDDNVSGILDHLRERKLKKAEGEGATSGGGRVHIGLVRVVDGALAALDETAGEAQIGSFDAVVRPDGEGEVTISNAALHLAAGPRAAADKLVAQFRLEHGKLDGLPDVTVAGASATPVHGLALTGITGTVRPDAGDPTRANIAVKGSYGGADAELWNASGWIRPEKKEGQIKLRADRFKLSQLRSMMSDLQLVNAQKAAVDAHFDVAFGNDQVTFGGAVHLAGLTVAHPMLAPIPVEHIGFDARTHGLVDLRAHTLFLPEAAVDFRNVHASLTAQVENLGRKPRFNATFKVKPMPCQTALAAIPAELVPNLQGFKLAGTFSTDLHLGIDMEDLDTPIDLGGQVGIEGCKVVEAPPNVDAEKHMLATFVQTVQTEPGKWMTFFAGPENPSWVPYDQISPHLINSIMTTEDNGFFKHRGFIPSEFRSALQQNLQKGYFRLGASSITMQMVKNVLLSREKTLSRKLQELFLTWYIEHHLTKERILEVYFNVIEFGPGIYGIGRAARHYFGKSAKDLEPQEAAFFSSILPSPKRRYVQYCHANGLLDAKWDAYIKRIMKRNHERGRLTDEEYERALATPLRFDRTEAMAEKDCVAWVKKITTPLVPPAQAAQASAKP